MDFDWKINGNQYQATREGYNLYDVNTLIVNQENVTVEKNETGYIITSDDTVTPSKIGKAVIETTSLFDISKNYTFSCDITLNKAGKSVAGWVRLENTIQKDMTANQKEHVVIRINSQVGTYLTLGLYTSNCVMTVENIQLVEGTEDKPFEQYGASPSIDYPSPVKSVGDNVNLFPGWEIGAIDGATGNKITDPHYIRSVDFIPILPNIDYTIYSINSFGFDSINTALRLYDKDKKYLGSQFLGEILEKNLTFKITNLDARFMIPTSTNGKTNVVSGNAKVDIKLEKGIIATPCSPFGMGSVEIDVLNKNLLYYINKNQTIKGIDYTINQDKSIKVKGTATEYSDFYLRGTANQYEDIGLVGTFKLSGCNSGNSRKYMLYIVKKDKFGNLEYYQNVKGDTTFTISKGDTLRIFIRVLTGVTVDDVIYPMLRVSTDTDSSYTEAKKQSAIMPVQQEMLTGDYIADVEHHEWGKIESYNNEEINTEYISTTGELSQGATVYYKLETPIDLELTEEQKAVRDTKLYTYKNITNIAVSDELASIDVTYKKDLETMFNNIIKQMPNNTSDTAET